MIIKNCGICKKNIRTYSHTQRYCSVQCGNVAKKQYKPTTETKKKISDSMKGKLPNNFWNMQAIAIVNQTGKFGKESKHWKGDDVGYGGLHDWIRRQFGVPTKCERCLGDGFEGRKIHWHNISGKYNRERDDWIRLCASCHMLVDRYNNNLYLQKGFN